MARPGPSLELPVDLDAILRVCVFSGRSVEDIQPINFVQYVIISCSKFFIHGLSF
jgi:hypothetical protein